MNVTKLHKIDGEYSGRAAQCLPYTTDEGFYQIRKEVCNFWKSIPWSKILRYINKRDFYRALQTVLVESAVFDYEINKNSLRAQMPGTAIPSRTHSVQHKNSNIPKQNIKLFLKLRYVVVIPMLFKLVLKKMGVTVFILKPLFLKARLTSVASQAA